MVGDATSPGGAEVGMLEIGKEIKPEKKKLPAVLMAANMEGTRPLTTEGAMFMASWLVENENALDKNSWFILPLGNPDAASRYFSKLKYESTANALPANNDMDDAVDEDGYNDLNGDGYITMMRVKDPMGTHIVVSDEPRLMRKADASSGEYGEYKLYMEGIDDDGDGEYNEDGP